MQTKVRTIYPSVFRKQEVIKELHRLYEEFVFGSSWQKLQQFSLSWKPIAKTAF